MWGREVGQQKGDYIRQNVAKLTYRLILVAHKRIKFTQIKMDQIKLDPDRKGRLCSRAALCGGGET